jgi:hypothetical protein
MEGINRSAAELMSIGVVWRRVVAMLGIALIGFKDFSILQNAKM